MLFSFWRQDQLLVTGHFGSPWHGKQWTRSMVHLGVPARSCLVTGPETGLKTRQQCQADRDMWTNGPIPSRRQGIYKIGLRSTWEDQRREHLPDSSGRELRLSQNGAHRPMGRGWEEAPEKTEQELKCLFTPPITSYLNVMQSWKIEAGYAELYAEAQLIWTHAGLRLRAVCWFNCLSQHQSISSYYCWAILQLQSCLWKNGPSMYWQGSHSLLDKQVTSLCKCVIL